MSRTPKAAVVIIIDIGFSESLSTQENSNFLKKSRDCTSMVMQRKIFSCPKDEVGVILMGSEHSNNVLYNGDIYKNISVALPLRESNWDSVRKFESETSHTNIKADWLEAVAVALNYLKKATEVGKFGEKKVVLFTSNLNNGSSRNLPLIEDDLKDLLAELIVIYPSLTDKTEVKKAKEIVDQVKGSLYVLEDALPQLMSFQKKKVKPQPWNVFLDIGSEIKIPVTGYKKVNDNQKPSWKICPATEKDDNVLIEREVTYHREDKTKVYKSDVVEGYCYGSTLVPFTEDDKNQLSYESGPKCLSLLKITQADFVPRHMWMGNSGLCFVARDGDENAATAFSALVHALDQLKSVAIVRRVYNNGNRPRIGALIPCVKIRKEYLLYVELPFSHDLRHCLLPELNAGNLKEDQLNAVDRLIEMMDLSVPEQIEGREEEQDMAEREWSELLRPSKTLDPYLQHVRRCISHRALFPKMPLPDPDPDILKAMVEPPPTIKEAAADCLKEIISLFPNLVQETSPNSKASGKRNIADSGAAEVKDAVNKEEITSKRMKEAEPEYVGSLKPLEDFKAAVGQENVSFAQVCHQMQNVIQQLVLSSLGKEDFEKPKESLEFLRRSIINSQFEKADAILSYNNWMKDLQINLKKNLKMGFWRLVIEDNVGFIAREECPESMLTRDEVRKLVEEDAPIHKDYYEDDDMDDCYVLGEI